MYDALLARDDDMKLVPELAASYRQIDAPTFEFTLRQGVHFYDGSEMTADDVAFTFDRLTRTGAMGGQTSPRKSLLGPLDSVSIVDPHTVRFHLAKPWPNLPAYLPFQEIVSKAFVERVGTQGMATGEDGTGPFKLAEWRRGDQVVMQRFDGYYGGSPEVPPVGRARVDRAIFRFIPDNASRVAALLAGEVDIIDQLPIDAMKQVEANADTRVLTSASTNSFFIDLNNTHPPFDDARVRQAVNYAVDRKLIIDRLLGGLATPLNGLPNPQSFGFNPHLEPFDYDLAKSRSLLAAAGHADGVDATLDVDNSQKDIGETVATMLTRAGIRAKVQLWERTTLTQVWSKPAGNGRDMMFRSWGDGALDPVGIFVPVLHGGGSGNDSGYANKQVDALLDAAEVEPDEARRSDLYQQA
jgi:peptide/nickel transport system substrate-binding protein